MKCTHLTITHEMYCIIRMLLHGVHTVQFAHCKKSYKNSRDVIEYRSQCSACKKHKKHLFLVFAIVEN